MSAENSEAYSDMDELERRLSTTGGLGKRFPHIHLAKKQQALRVRLTAPRRNSPPTQLRKMMVEVVVVVVKMSCPRVRRQSRSRSPGLLLSVSAERSPRTAGKKKKEPRLQHRGQRILQLGLRALISTTDSASLEHNYLH
ncbi:hypothetical protein EYF80_018733 [Liparis tanakae]|uniref:Uncharacterized protein n=1 Tax=Liparis tanakae TaxID=230148 RepID=A0A4Z2I1F2_9TELE|nr:hypothetical protein EYF80_018733 [Liparis tanakae]